MISIKEAKQIREQLGLTHIVILGIDKDNKQYVATHGKSKVDAKQAAEMGNNMKKELQWPIQKCNDRGWDIKPKKEFKPYFDAVMTLLENVPKRFS